MVDKIKIYCHTCAGKKTTTEKEYPTGKEIEVCFLNATAKAGSMDKMKLKGIVQNGPEQIIDVEIGKEDDFAFYSAKGKIYPKVCWVKL